jgi:hypothetical protein
MTGQVTALPVARVEIARRIVRERQMRARFFPERLFAEAAWDILLDLYIIGWDGRAVAVTSACLAAAVPMTTALRTMGVLVAMGLLERHPHPHDARASRVSLTVEGLTRIDRYIDAIR